jgi:hypothetical protein
VDAEVATYARELRWVLGEVCAALRDLPPAALDWRPATGSASSPAAIATHVAAATRVYALGFGCGQPVARDRPAEFAAAGIPVDRLIALLDGVARDLDAALAGLTAADLDHRFTPPQALWGTTPAHEISRRDALVESLRHAALHLGELRLTRDLARQATGGP